MKPRKWRATTPTKKQIRAAFDAQAPHDGSTKPLTKRKTLRPNYDGVGGTDGKK